MPVRGRTSAGTTRGLRRTLSSPITLLATRLADRPPQTHRASDRPRAAVAVVLAPDPDAMLSIRRAERDADVWSGHLAFPGGRAAPGEDLRETAERETREEVGLELATARRIGQLDDIAPNTRALPPIVVRPFVFALPRALPLVPNHEVAGAAWIPLSDFTRPGVLRPVEHQRHGTLVRMAGYHLEFGVVWGLTERILTPLLDLLRTDS